MICAGGEPGDGRGRRLLLRRQRRPARGDRRAGAPARRDVLLGLVDFGMAVPAAFRALRAIADPAIAAPSCATALARRRVGARAARKRPTQPAYSAARPDRGSVARAIRGTLTGRRPARLCETAGVIDRASGSAGARGSEFDVAVIGGGITGAGVALDAATRGYSVALLERADYASGTSSRSSKLVHGGLRYLQNFDLGLVREALLERQLMVALAPHLVRPLPLVVRRLRRCPARSPGRRRAEPV